MAKYKVSVEHDERLSKREVRPCMWEVDARGMYDATRQLCFFVGEDKIGSIVVVEAPNGRREAVDVYAALNRGPFRG